MSQTNWEADKMTNEKHTEVAASYIESQLIKTREQQQQSHQPQYLQQQQQQQLQLQMQQLLLQRQAQQQQQQHHQQQWDSSHLPNGSANGAIGNELLTRQNPGTANALATQMYEEKLKLPIQRDSLDDAAMKQRFGDNVGQLLDPNHDSISKSAAATGPHSRQVLYGATGGMSPQVQARSQQFPGPTPEVKTEMNSILNPRALGPEGSLIGIPGSNQGGNNLTLKGWPLTGLDQLRSGLIQQQESFIQGPQPFHQLQMLTPQHQQQLLLAQQNLTSPSASDVESRRLRMLHNNQNMSIGKDSLLNSVGRVVPNIGSPMQAGGPIFPRADEEMLMKMKVAQLQQQQNSNQTQQQHALSGQQPQSLNHSLQQDKMMGIGGDGSVTNSFRGNDQVNTCPPCFKALFFLILGWWVYYLFFVNE
ncbi:Hypothetical predicted protein [Olea europaea subsp. europaea]|uniref:Uncharacterized protein n=1 Tax=Olea europaea subsp. europaea TaxID=158383 RepID=A0A8S0TMI4_OLEEU|nr:Hypothetical predicted protein [Olea europaea subsp. europaea]